MAKVVCLSVVLVLAMASSTAALKCWSCDYCRVQPATMTHCPTENHYCRTKKESGYVKWRGCSLLGECEIIKEKKSLMDKMKSRVSDVAGKVKDTIQGNEDHPDAPKTPSADEPSVCCKWDYCNAASSKIINNFLVLPLALYLLCCWRLQ